MQDHLSHFAESLSSTFFDNTPITVPPTWQEAFKILRVQSLKYEKKVVIFLDELPWLASRRSKLLQVIEHDWNRYFSQQSNIIFIVCGSSASWVVYRASIFH